MAWIGVLEADLRWEKGTVANFRVGESCWVQLARPQQGTEQMAAGDSGLAQSPGIEKEKYQAIELGKNIGFGDDFEEEKEEGNGKILTWASERTNRIEDFLTVEVSPPTSQVLPTKR